MVVGYPFEDNPLDSYLEQMFDLRLSEADLCYKLGSSDSSPEVKLASSVRLKEVLARIRVLRAELPLQPRSYDVFLSGPELAVEQFKREYPEPTEGGPCAHSRTHLTRRFFRDGKPHVVSQCLECGGQVRAHSRTGVDITALPDFSDSLAYEINGYRWWWHEERNRVELAASSEGNEAPEFDYAAFDANYLELNPKPPGRDCEHESAEVRVRKYDSGATALVEQCTDCGKHLKSVKKSLVSNWQELPEFDLGLAPVATAAAVEWTRRYLDAAQSARKQHSVDVARRIARGEIAFRDHSKFGTYYDSEQWVRTRTRILLRDDHLCQACHAPAECVHHIVYDRLGQENDLDLISLCNSCHDKIHKEQRAFHNLFRMPPWQIKRMRDSWAWRSDSIY